MYLRDSPVTGTWHSVLPWIRPVRLHHLGKHDHPGYHGLCKQQRTDANRRFLHLYLRRILHRTKGDLRRSESDQWKVCGRKAFHCYDQMDHTGISPADSWKLRGQLHGLVQTVNVN